MRCWPNAFGGPCRYDASLSLGQVIRAQALGGETGKFDAFGDVGLWPMRSCKLRHSRWLKNAAAHGTEFLRPSKHARGMPECFGSSSSQAVWAGWLSTNPEMQSIYGFLNAVLRPNFGGRFRTSSQNHRRVPFSDSVTGHCPPAAVLVTALWPSWLIQPSDFIEIHD
jgi:hypothetical protein